MHLFFIKSQIYAKTLIFPKLESFSVAGTNIYNLI